MQQLQEQLVSDYMRQRDALVASAIPEASDLHLTCALPFPADKSASILHGLSFSSARMPALPD